MNCPTDHDLKDRDTPLDADKLMPDERIREWEANLMTGMNDEDWQWLCQTARSAHYFADLAEHSRASLIADCAEKDAQIARLREALGRLLHELPGTRTSYSVDAWSAYEDGWRAVNNTDGPLNFLQIVAVDKSSPTSKE